jgi:hypothetical protein
VPCIFADLPDICIVVDVVSFENDPTVWWNAVTNLRPRRADNFSKAHVEFVNSKLPAGDYDLIVAADGMFDRTRVHVFVIGRTSCMS